MKRLTAMILAAMMIFGTTAKAEDGPPADGAPTVVAQQAVGKTVQYKDKAIKMDVPPQTLDGIVMVPLRATLEAMGFDVTWNSGTKMVEMMKGAQWTAITIGKNDYFRNRMAGAPLSAAPTIVDGRTLVPVEFFVEIIGANIIVENGNISFSDEEPVIHRGYVHSIEKDETGGTAITLSKVEGSEEPMDWVIIYIGDAYTFKQVAIKEGAHISVVGASYMTMSIPGQTSGYILW